MMTTVQEVFPQKVQTKVASVRRHMLASGCSSYKKSCTESKFERSTCEINQTMCPDGYA